MKILGPILGALGLSLIFVLFYWLEWQEQMREHVADVKSQLKVMESFWNRESNVIQGRLTVGYREAVEVGYPLSKKVRLLGPYLQDERGEAIFTITLKYLDFVVQEDGSFKLDYPAEGDATIRQGASIQNYYLHLSDQPPVFVRKTDVGGRTPAAFNEYGITYPSQLIFTADSGNKAQRYPLVLTSTAEPLWQPIFSDIRERLGSLRGLLRRGVMGL